MLHEALTHWDKGSATAHLSRRSRYRWWNRLPLRDLATEQEFELDEFVLDDIAQIMGLKVPRSKSSTGRWP